MKENRTIKLWLITAILVTLVINLRAGTSGVLLWTSAFAGIFNLYLTNTRNKLFIIPDLIWII